MLMFLAGVIVGVLATCAGVVVVAGVILWVEGKKDAGLAGGSSV